MKLLVYPLMVLLFAGSMWLIFAPSSADKAKEEAGKGFNIEMPAADSTGVIADKRKAYEVAEMEQLYYLLVVLRILVAHATTLHYF